jgi:pimeloyl-ACP methyl ester carboxylesterase
MQLHFTSLGAGEPLIVLHGLLGSHQNLLPASRKFAEHFQVFALDQRNHGHSPHHDQMSYELMADDVVRFMDAHQLAAAHVLGHSMGGKTAMHLALHHPARVNKLVVADMSPRAYGPRFAKLLHALRELQPERFKTRQEGDQALAASIPEESLRQFLLKNLVPAEPGGYRWRIHLESIATNYDHLRGAVHSAIPFTGEALFVLGGNSDYVGDADKAEARRLFPSAEFTSIAGAGHWVHVEKPMEFAAIVCNFLRS